MEETVQAASEARAQDHMLISGKLHGKVSNTLRTGPTKVTIMRNAADAGDTLAPTENIAFEVKMPITFYFASIFI